MTAATARADAGLPPTGVLAWTAAILDRLDRDHGFQYCAVLIADAGSGSLRVVARRWGASDEGDVKTGEALVPIAGSVTGAVFSAASPVLVNDVRQHPDYLRAPGVAMRSELAVPIVAAGQAIGVLNVESPRVGGFGIGDLERLTAEAANAAATAPLGALMRPEPDCQA